MIKYVTVSEKIHTLTRHEPLLSLEELRRDYLTDVEKAALELHIDGTRAALETNLVGFDKSDKDIIAKYIQNPVNQAEVAAMATKPRVEYLHEHDYAKSILLGYDDVASMDIVNRSVVASKWKISEPFGASRVIDNLAIDEFQVEPTLKDGAVETRSSHPRIRFYIAKAALLISDLDDVSPDIEVVERQQFAAFSPNGARVQSTYNHVESYLNGEVPANPDSPIILARTALSHYAYKKDSADPVGAA